MKRHRVTRAEGSVCSGRIAKHIERSLDELIVAHSDQATQITIKARRQLAVVRAKISQVGQLLELLGLEYPEHEVEQLEYRRIVRRLRELVDEVEDAI